MATKRLTAALAGASLLAFATTASADDALMYHKFPAWSVMVDRSLGNGCFATASYQNNSQGTFLRFGFNVTADEAYVMVGSEQWASLQLRSAYSLQLSFNGGPPVTWTGRAFTMSAGARAIYLPTKNKDFVTIIARSSNLTISFEGRTVLSANLPGTDQAMRAMVDCQQAYGYPGDNRSNGDPFTGTAAPNGDPFKRL